MTPRVAALVEGQWYRDSGNDGHWKILALHEHTVDVMDSWGNRTTHNRMAWENGEMRPVDGPDPDVKKSRRTPV